METKKFCLTERQMPTQWYNIVADMPNKPLPPLHPGTKKPVTKEQMSAIFAEELIDQEMSTERYIDIPEEVQEIYRIWRPTPLVRATGLEKALGTPAKIFFKNESVSPAGSHKPNTAVPQAYYNYKQGIRRLTTETGAGQWGAAIAFAAKHFGIPFYVAAPVSTFDLNMGSGKEIVIEQRSQDEVNVVAGHRIAPEGSQALNPAFDVTPADLVTGFITEKGILRPDEVGVMRD